MAVNEKSISSIIKEEIVTTLDVLTTKLSKSLADSIVDRIDEKLKTMEEKIKIMDETEKRLVGAAKTMESHIEAANNKIVLDVGGTKFVTSKSTLLSQKGSFFEAMLASGKWKPDSDGSYFIDRDPKHFSVILNFLRKGKVLMEANDTNIEEFQDELDFYQLMLPNNTPSVSNIPPVLPFSESNVLNASQKQHLLSWFEKKVTTTTLLYSATRDSFGIAQFHTKCDNKGPTVVVLRSTGSYLFGGYAPQPWDSSSTWKKAPGCFLFTLTNPHNIPPTKYPLQSTDNAMYCRNDRACAFGGGHDLGVFDSSNTNSKSYTNFPNTYQDTTGKGNTTFTGAYYFQTNEIEVFLVE